MKVQLEDILSKLQETVIQPQSDQCRIKYTLSIVNSKWNWMVIALLYQKEVRRYGEIKRDLAPITDKVLHASLAFLEREKLVCRTEYPQIPPKVEYTLTEKGKALVPVLCEMYAWGETWRD